MKPKTQHIHVDEESVAYKCGSVIVNAIRSAAQISTGKVKFPSGEELQLAMQLTGNRWSKLKVAPLIIAEKFITTYRPQIEARHFRLSWLHVGQAADRIEKDLGASQKKIHELGYRPEVESGMEETAFEVNDSVSYARRLLRGAGVRLDDLNAVKAWLDLGIGSVNPVAALILTQGHPECESSFGRDVAETCVLRPALKQYLSSKGINTGFIK